MLILAPTATVVSVIATLTVLFPTVRILDPDPFIIKVDELAVLLTVELPINKLPEVYNTVEFAVLLTVELPADNVPDAVIIVELTVLLTVEFPTDKAVGMDVTVELAVLLTVELPIDKVPAVIERVCVVFATCNVVAVRDEFVEELPTKTALVFAKTLAPTYAIVVTETAVVLISELPRAKLIGVNVDVLVLFATLSCVVLAVLLIVLLPIVIPVTVAVTDCSVLDTVKAVVFTNTLAPAYIAIVLTV